MEEPLKLIFFDTFSHESSEEINLDLVQFPKPVFIGEVRIIPLGARVQADFPGGVRLGATNPSQFKIEFFVNDLSKPGASTFEHLGAIDYNQNGNIHFEYDHSRRPIPTDGLVLRGWYTTITLAVYGVLTKTTPPEPSQPDMVSSVDWLQQQMEDGTRDIMVEGGHHYASYPQDEEAYSGQDYRSQSYVWHQESYETPKESYEGENWEVRQEEKHWERNKERHQENFRYERREERSPEYERTPEYDARDYKNRRWNEWNRKRPHTPPPPSSRETSPQQGQFESMSPGDVESISEGDIPETEGVEESGKSPSTPPIQASPQQKTGEPFEPILSDDEIVDDQDMEYDFSEFTEDPLQSFNPYNNQIPLLKSFMDPAVTVYEWKTVDILKTTDEDGEALKNLINSISNLHENKGIWVETAEQVISCISKLPKVATDERKDILDKLMTWVAFGLNFQEAYEQPQPGLKLRHIKAGIRLVETLSNCGENIAMKMIDESDAQNKLLDLYHEDHMALVIKLMILRSLDATLRYQKCVEKFVDSYDRLLDMIQANQHARVKYALCALIQKLHFYDLLKNLDKQDESFLSLSMEEILKIFINAPKILSHPKRFLPVVQFEIINDFDPYKAIYSYFRHFNIIKIFIKLFSEHIKVVAPINGLISELLDSDDGLKFLASTPEINSLIQLLLGSSKNEGINPTLGLHLAYRLQALNYLDSINNIKIDADKPEIIDNIQGLFNLTLSNIGNIGKSSVVHVLSQGTNIEILINILKTKINKKRSPSRGYITDLISLTVKFTTHVPFLRKYAEILTQLCAEFSELEIQNWLPNENHYEIIKNHENCCSLPPELITAVKIIKYSSIPKHETDLFNNFKSDFTELKYKFNILQLYSNDGLSYLTSILSKLNKHYDQPYLHSSRFIARHGLLLLSLVLPSVQLIRRMITYVINVRNTDFKDLTVVNVFLRTYALMQAIPLNAQAHNDAVRVCREIIETFLAFTQPVEMSENEMNKSLWTAMVSEVVNFASEVPSNFMPGLMVLSELLPLPLPIQADSEDEIFVNMRRLWSAHLLSLSSNIETMISTMSSSSCYPLLQLLRRVCIQLSDLAAPTAILVVKSIIEAIDEKNPIHVGRQMNFLASLMNHGVIKIAFIHSLNEKNLANFSKCFESKNSQIQEGLSSICHSIFDTEIFLVPPPPSSSPETFLSCAIPPKDVILIILSSMINYLNDASFTTSLTVIRSLILLTEHDYGFFHLKNVLEKQSENLMAFVGRIEKFVKENCSSGKVEWSPEKQECLALLSSLLELFRNLLNPEEAEYHLRNHKMVISELATLLNWPSEDHPLSVIEEILKKVEDDGQQGIEQILSSLAAFFVKLSDPEKTVEKLEVPEPILPPPEPILTQFSLRMIFTNEREEDRLTAAYWLSVPNNDDPEQESDLVSVDLYEIARADLGVINLSEAIAQLFERKTETAEVQGQKVKVNNAAKKPFVAPARGRGGIRGGNVRSSDTFRSRPPNTSRPPSLHVDDFVALETSGTANYTKTVPQDKTRGRGRGRTFGMDRGRFYSSHPYHREGEMWDRNQVYGNEMDSGVRFGRSQRPLLPWGSKDPRPQRGLNRHIRFFQS